MNSEIESAVKKCFTAGFFCSPVLFTSLALRVCCAVELSDILNFSTLAGTDYFIRVTFYKYHFV